MSNILFMGNTGCLSRKVCERVAEEYRVILAGKDIEQWSRQKTVVTCRLGEEPGQVEDLFHMYDFCAVFYFSEYLEEGEETAGAGRYLEQFLEACRRYRESRIVVFMPHEALNYMTKDSKNEFGEYQMEYAGKRSFLIHQQEELCRFYKERLNLQICLVRIPCIVSESCFETYLGTVFRKIYQKEELTLRYGRWAPVDFLTEEDFARLIVRLADADQLFTDTLMICSGFPHTYGELADSLSGLFDQGSVGCGREPCIIVIPPYPTEARRYYGWFAITDGFLDIRDSYEQYKKQQDKKAPEKKEGLWQRILRRRREEGLPAYIELAVFFVIVEALNLYLGSSVYFQFVDLRLLFVVIMGTVHGMKLGLLATVCASAALTAGYLRGGMDATALFYNINNWIPYVAYFMAGAISGYTKNTRSDELRFLKKEYDLLRNKYLYLNQLYQTVLENKLEYKRQILGYKDSFGRIFNAVQKLNNVLPDRIFSEALEVFEDLLENHSIAIYMPDQWQRYARLVVSSNQMLRGLNRSVELGSYPKMMEVIRLGEVWRNSSFLEHYPAYACGIFRKEKLVLLVMVYQVTQEQQSLYYTNLIRILGGLMQNAFLNALDYMELSEEKIYDPGTHIMKPDHFREVLKIREDMKQKNIADYILLHIISDDWEETSAKLNRLIRSSDILGRGTDGKLYLLLVQVDEANFAYVENRLIAQGIVYERTERMEES